MSERVFGLHAAIAVFESGAQPIELVCLQDNYAKNQKLNALYEQARKRKLNIQKLNKQELDVACDGGNHQGILLHLAPADRKLSEKLLFEFLADITEPKLILLLDQIQDPHNLGACLRTAAAAGVQVVIAPKDSSASITPVVRKTASGATESIPYVQVTNLARTMKQLQAMGVWITGTDLGADKTPYDIDFTGDIAIVIGSEGKGLRRLVKEHCDYLVKIPMPGEFESLNASVATGVMLFEAVRQRTVK